MAKKARNYKRKNGAMKVYSSLSYQRKQKIERKARERAKRLDDLPKDPWKRFLAHFKWKRIKAYWFSKAGLKRIGKIFAAIFLLAIIAVGALFLYYKHQVASIELDQLSVKDTVNVYLDRNGKVLWEDKGDGDYRLVVNGDEIAESMRQATVAIEDKNFYNHSGVDFGAIIRAVIATLTGQGVQGGSTLTQQLVKQVYFSDEAGDRTVTGIPRKIKELILSLELEKMYSKEQIITMYLNESPYGGRRNGVESAAQTYFGKSAKELSLAESALIAAIPNNPAVLNPYNTAGNEMLLERQHKVLDVMVEMGYVTQEEADTAKQVAVLDQIKPETTQYENILAPHFVLETKDLLEEKYGIQTMRSGGFTITTSLDYRAQEMAEAAVATGASMMGQNRSDNISLSSVDVETGQVIAMVGSADWNAPVYGEVNAATSPLEPGSSIKPILDYTGLFVEREGVNYGPGSVLKDENIDSIYCAGYRGTCALRNYTGRFYGNITIRQALANSLNIPAVKALYINGIDNGLETAHALGDKNYCADNETAGLSMAIGSGCNVIPIEHANAYASLARGGVYKELTYVLELKDSSGNVIEKWEDSDGERVVDEQVAYMVEDILGDASARSLVFGSQANAYGFRVNGVWTGSKTGTTTTANSAVTKDSWMASFSTAVATVVWNGNHDGAGLANSSNNIVRRVVNDYMGPVHLELYANEGKWKSGDKPIKPAGIQTLNVGGRTDIWPSWFNSKKSNTSNTTLEFNKYTHKLASPCTPDDQKITVNVTKMIDPMTKHEIWNVPEPYNRDEQDDCSYRAPTASLYHDNTQVSAKIMLGSLGVVHYELQVDGKVVKSGSVTSNNSPVTYTRNGNEKTATIKITDDAGYEATASQNL